MDSPSIYGWWLPPDVSAHGAIIDQIILIMHVFMVALFVGWGLFFVYCLVRFRQRPGHKARHEIPHSKLPKFLEIGVVIFEAFILVGLSYPAWSKLRTAFPPRESATNIRIVAQQFGWNIHYPGKDGVFGRTDPKLVSDSNTIGLDLNDPNAKDDITTLGQLHFPVDKPVIANLTSKDVIHSLFIPVLRVKHDAIPGMNVPIWWEAKQTGQFEIACAQLCGNGHTTMRGFVSIDTPEEYAAWMAEKEKELEPAPQ
ncbi:MAG TPA: cytochrome c oxidase subunit II [bacterium]|nr:cytochrome c oxidase subunit II [bacterium]